MHSSFLDIYLSIHYLGSHSKTSNTKEVPHAKTKRPILSLNITSRAESNSVSKLIELLLSISGALISFIYEMELRCVDAKRGPTVHTEEGWMGKWIPKVLRYRMKVVITLPGWTIRRDPTRLLSFLLFAPLLSFHGVPRICVHLLDIHIWQLSQLLFWGRQICSHKNQRWIPFYLKLARSTDFFSIFQKPMIFKNV